MKKRFFILLICFLFLMTTNVFASLEDECMKNIPDEIKTKLHNNSLVFLESIYIPDGSHEKGCIMIIYAKNADVDKLKKGSMKREKIVGHALFVFCIKDKKLLRYQIIDDKDLKNKNGKRKCPRSKDCPRKKHFPKNHASKKDSHQRVFF